MARTSPSKKSPRFGQGFTAYVLVWVLALVARAIYVWQIRESPLFALLTGDAVSYGICRHDVDARQAVLEVYVEKDTAEVRRALPHHVDGVAVKVVETGPIVAY
jgi:hypothetical protein